MDLKKLHFTIVISALVLATGIVAGLWLHAWQNGLSQSNDAISITGSAKIKATSDLVKWTAGFSLQADLSNIKQKLDEMNSNVGKIRGFIKNYDLKDENITFVPLTTDPIYETIPGYGMSQNVIGYNIRQEVRVESPDISKVEKLTQEVRKLIDQGVVPEYQRTEYYYTKLTDLRPQVFAEATKDAQIKAAAIASVTGVKVGKLKVAKTGVIQVLPPNSTDISDWGQYDLSTKEKEVSGTVTVTFELIK